MTVPELAESRSLLLSRWAAAWIDFVAVFGILVLGDWLLGNALYQRTIAVWLLLAAAYYPVLEGLTGKTVGRYVTRTMVVDEDGMVPGIRRSILRTIPRIIEVNPLLFGGVPAGVVVLLSSRHQRLGDMWAGTYVVRQSELASLRDATAVNTAAAV
jgi:uncharacterized RDD family membrane protein YckC